MVGRGGRELGAEWAAGHPEAYKGVAVPGYPNLFLVLGPNTGLGHNSVLVMMEAQFRYLTAALDHLRECGAPAVEVRRDAHDAYQREMARRTGRTVWASGCDSWYLDEPGHNFTPWPGLSFTYHARMRRFDGERYTPVA